MPDLPLLHNCDVQNRHVLVRLDLNLPMQGGRVTDDTRLQRALPTLKYLIDHRAKIIICSHFGRPKGKYSPSLSLAPLVDTLEDALMDAGCPAPVKFAPDCVGDEIKDRVEMLESGEIILLENLRFHAEEESNEQTFSKQLASIADLYVNDAFSCSHRAHASIVGVTEYLPSVAGLLLAKEVNALDAICTKPERPLAAIVGGSKISTKITLLTNLVQRVDVLIIGGAMANTFLAAEGHAIGQSLCEHDMLDTAREVLAEAKKNNCTIILPEDTVVATEFSAHAASSICMKDTIPNDGMVLDIGPSTVSTIQNALKSCKMVVWNGPLGAFETSPFDTSTIQIARMLALLTKQGTIETYAGGGDTVAALAHAGLTKQISYLSTAGGAFLEWLEGKTLPGIAALQEKAGNTASRQAAQH